MAIPPEAAAKLWDFGLEYGIKVVSTWLSNPRVQKTVSPKEAESGCQTCLIHQHVVLAHGYIRGLASRLNPDGSVPAGLGGTIDQARTHIRETMSEIPGIMGSHPAIDKACEELTKVLPEVLVRLDDIQTQEQWDTVLLQLQSAEHLAYTIPETIYRREEPIAPEPKGEIVVLTAEEANILHTMADVRTGKITEQQAKAKLGPLLAGEK